MRHICGSRMRTCWCLLGLLAFLLFYYLHHYRDVDVDVNIPTTVSHNGANTRYEDHTVVWRAGSASHTQLSGRYILGLNYWEQLTMATKNLFHLVCLGTSWNATTVQPFTSNSRLYGLRNFKADEHVESTKPAENLELIFNMDSLNSVLEDHGLPKLVPFQDFLKRSSREVTVIHYISAKEVHEIPVMVGETGRRIRSAFQHDSVVDCMDLLKSYRARLTAALNNELDGSYLHFTIVKYLCVNMSTMTTPQELATRIGINLSGDLTLLVVNWRGTSRNEIMQSAKGTHTNNRIAMRNVCTDGISMGAHKPILHSDKVLKTTRHYASVAFDMDLKRPQNCWYVGVHVRTEKMGFRETRFPGSIAACVEELLTTQFRFAGAKSDPGMGDWWMMTVVYATDYGQYSSDTCKHCGSGKKISKLLTGKGNTMTPIKFDPTPFNYPTDSGFVAAVEAELLASATYLVLCGGGAFQSHIGRLFLEHKGNSTLAHQSLAQICTDDKSVKTLMNRTMKSL